MKSNIGLTLDIPIDFAFSPRLSLILIESSSKNILFK